MGLLRQLFDYLIITFFVTHIPITMFVDSQGLFPRQLYPQFARSMLDDFNRDFKDPLVGRKKVTATSRHFTFFFSLFSNLWSFSPPFQMTPPLSPWFKSLVWSEILLQFPFFFFGAYAFITRKNWIRIPAIIYGSFVVATMFPILAELAAHTAPGYNSLPVIGFYLPYLIVPLLLVVVMAATPAPFPSSSPKKKKRKTK